jgi:signal transduction histidine kinase
MSFHTGISIPRPPLLQRITPRQWFLTDVGLSALFLAGGFVSLFVGHHGKDHPHHVALLAAALCVATLPIALRRRYPIPVLVVVTGALAAAVVLGQDFAGVPAVALALYIVATQYERRTSVIALCIVEGVLLASLGIAAIVHATDGNDTFNIILAGATWFVGDSVRARRAYVSGLALQSEQRQRREVERAEQSIAEERLQIARELHDIVAHSLSVIAIQSGVGGHVLDMQPEEARKALAAVEMTSRSALEELRRVLGVLRRDDSDGASLTPAPGIDDIDELLIQFRSAGVEVDFQQSGERVELPPSMDLSVYRIVQEALTNVTKHARGAAATVHIHFEDGAVSVNVFDEGFYYPNSGDSMPKVEDEARAHHGIIGMRERAAVFGGSLTAGPRQEGGFEVCARLPLKPSSR